MENLIFVLFQLADVVSGRLNELFVPFADIVNILVAGGTVSLAFAGGISWSDIPAEVLASARRWHGSIDEQFGNIDNLVVTIQGHASWGTPPQFTQVVANHGQLRTLVTKCKSSAGSANDRARRNTLLKATVALCLTSVKLWAYAQYNTNPTAFTIDDLHSLGFLLPGETSGRRSRSVAVSVAAEAKVTVLSADMIRVAIDQASGENAALVVHGWPDGVHTALIVITSADDGTEICRRQTTRLHNDIRMPEGSHGKAFVVKAAFLKHVDDEPVFGPQPTFTMPYSTEDLIHTLDRQHHEEFEAQIREVERQRQELDKSND
jgi:hypothetical protein